MRIARVKFGLGHKPYDYFCEDKSITEGDIVYVEGKEQPLFVDSIVEMSSAECKATKYVIKKAKENHNVVLESKYMNITKCNCECIVNSLGPQTNVFGAICNSVVETANSDEISNMLKDNPTADIFQMFVTDAGKLPSKHIIHIVMPFKSMDTNHNDNLRKAFSLVIDKAISLGYKSIGIPYIGTGANGYQNEDIAATINSILFEYQYKENINMKIVSIVYNPTGDSRRFKDVDEKYYNERFFDKYLEQMRSRHLQNENYYHKEHNSNLKPPRIYNDRLVGPTKMNSVKEKTSQSYYYSDKKTQFILEAYDSFYNPKDEYELTEDVDNPVDYIRNFKKKKKLYNISGDYQSALSYPNQTKVSSGERQIKKNEVINLAIACRMNFTEFVQFMFFSGFSISTNSKNDIEIALLQYLIDNKRFAGLALTYSEIAGKVGNEAVNTLFAE